MHILPPTKKRRKKRLQNGRIHRECMNLDFIFLSFDDFLRYEKKLGFVVFANQSTVYSGGVIRGRVWVCGC